MRPSVCLPACCHSSFVWCEGVWSWGSGWGAEFVGVGKHSATHRSNPDEPQLQPITHHLHRVYGPASGKFSSLWECFQYWTSDVVLQVPLCWPGRIRAHSEDRKHRRETEGEYSDQQWPTGTGKCYRGTRGPKEERLSHTIQRL